MNEQYEDTVVVVKTYDKSIQKAWNILSMHNSELLLRVAVLEKRLGNTSVLTLIKWKIQGWFNKDKYL